MLSDWMGDQINLDHICALLYQRLIHSDHEFTAKHDRSRQWGLMMNKVQMH